MRLRFLIPLVCDYAIWNSSRKFTRNFKVVNTNIKWFSSSRTKKTMDDNSVNTFRGKLDRYGGVIVHSEDEFCSPTEFPKKLEDSLNIWKETSKRAIWFKVHTNSSEWIPVLTHNGFKFHHAKDDYAMLYLWLPQLQNCNIPNYANTMIGVGALVVNDKKELLVVKEKHWRVRNHWKLPGGIAEPGENLADAAMREVYEETGILTKFESLLCFRHTHSGMFGCSDIYMVMHLKPLSDSIVKCDREIEAAQWMPAEEYLKHEETHEVNRFFVKQYFEHKERNLKIDCHHGLHPILEIPYTMYFLNNAENKD